MVSFSDAEVSILIKAVDQASAVLNNIGTNAQTASNKVTTSWQDSIKTLVAVGNTVGAVDNIIDSYTNLQLRVENAELRVIDARQSLNKLTAEGKQGTEEYVDAQRRLTIVQNNLERANNAVFGTYINIFASTLSLIASMPALITAIRTATAASLSFVAANLQWIALGAVLLALIYGVLQAVKKLTGGKVDLIAKGKELIATTQEEIKSILGIKGAEDDLNMTYDSQIAKLERLDALLTSTGKKGKSAFEYTNKQDQRLQELYKRGGGRSKADTEEMLNLEKLVQGFRLPPETQKTNTASATVVNINTAYMSNPNDAVHFIDRNLQTGTGKL